MRKVYVEKCASYDDARLTEIFEKILNDTDSIHRLKTGDTVLLKTNLIVRKEPQAAATTDPQFLRILGTVLRKRGFKVVIGDSPGGLFTRSALRSVYNACGLTGTLKNTDIELNFNTTVATVKNSTGGKPKEFAITDYIHYVDYIINVPKLKTHVAMVYTGAVKNMYGIVAGEHKFDYHVVTGTTDGFSRMLVDVYQLRKPDLNIMDAIIGMDHNGPTAGVPKTVGLVLAGEDGFALDLTALRITGIDPLSVPVMRAACERDLISLTGNDITIVGTPVSDATVNDFQLPDHTPSALPAIARSRVFLMLVEAIKPTIRFNRGKCTLCKKCGEICPKGAIDYSCGHPKIDAKKCIRCFCCHELCTAEAVEIRPSRLLKVILLFGLRIKSLQKTIDGMFGIVARIRNRNSN